MLKSEGEHVHNTSIWSLSQNLSNMNQKHSTTFQVHSCLKIDGHRRELKDFIFDMWDFLFGISKALRALRHLLKCILQAICCCFYLYVTYCCTWSHIERQKCMWQLWTAANSILNHEIRLRTGFGGHKDMWTDLHEDLLIAHGPTFKCAFCRNLKASFFNHSELILVLKNMTMHPHSTVQLLLCN